MHLLPRRLSSCGHVVCLQIYINLTVFFNTLARGAAAGCGAVGLWGYGAAGVWNCWAVGLLLLLLLGGGVVVGCGGLGLGCELGVRVWGPDYSSRAVHHLHPHVEAQSGATGCGTSSDVPGIGE